MTRDDDDRLLWQAFRARTAPTPSPCPDPNALAAYVDGSASLSETTEIERHLESCDACLGALAESRSLLATLPSAPVTPVAASRRWRAHAGWAAVAAALLAASATGLALGRATSLLRHEAAGLEAPELPFEGGAWPQQPLGPGLAGEPR